MSSGRSEGRTSILLSLSCPMDHAATRVFGVKTEAKAGAGVVEGDAAKGLVYPTPGASESGLRIIFLYRLALQLRHSGGLSTPGGC